MCGIVGTAGDWPPELLSSMNETIHHRGPDDAGEYRDPAAQLGIAMRRLSILDLEAGHQPMSNEDGTVWIVFNGEIFNSPELRPGLEARGHRFATRNSDTEVVLHLYEEYGTAALQDLNGMFAFVIYDQRRQLIFGARDRMGIKPLYYFNEGGRFAFASELKSLLKLPGLERSIDLQGLFHYMTLLYLPDSASIIRGIKRLPPGHSFIYSLRNREFGIQRYWQPSFAPVEQRSEEEWAEILRVKLREAVDRWTLSDVPIACALSGGLDSSVVVGLLAELGYPQIKTFSLGFVGEEEQAWNETELARQVSQRWGTEHHEIWLEPTSLLDDLISMVWHLDEPYGGGLPSWYVFREMGKHVKVGLTGTGGDELFGNYGKFDVYENSASVRTALAYRRWNSAAAEPLAQLVEPIAAINERLPSAGRWLGKGGIIARLPETLRQPFGQHYYANATYLSDGRKRADVFQFHQNGIQDTAVYLQRLFDTSSATNVRDGLAAVDFRTQLAEEFLLMTDRFSMAHALEARVPLLDHTLVELIFRIPAAQRSKPGNLKYLMKKATADLLPPDVLAGRKRGFVIPVKLWLRDQLRPLVQRLLAPERLKKQGIFQAEFYRQFVVPHLEGKADYTWQVWSALMFQLWHLIYIEERATSAPTFTWRDIC